MEANTCLDMKPTEIIAKLPYQDPFLFVGSIDTVDENGISGSYTFEEDSAFYRGHFKNKPVTPGVILIETMAQIGLVSLGIFLMNSVESDLDAAQIAFTSSEVDFYLPVYPGEKVTVKSVKEYFRFNKLKCKVQLFNQKDELVCRGTLAGMMKA